jgi:ribosomal protein S11
MLREKNNLKKTKVLKRRSLFTKRRILRVFALFARRKKLSINVLRRLVKIKLMEVKRNHFIMKKPWWSTFEKDTQYEKYQYEKKRMKVCCVAKPTGGNFFSTAFIKHRNKKMNKVLFTVTGGYCGNLGARRRTTTSAEEVGHMTAYRFMQNGISGTYIIFRCGFNKYIKSFLRGLRQSGLKVRGVRMEWKVAHNGFRPSNKKRV